MKIGEAKIKMSNDKVRIENDFLGSKEVPIDAYYGVQTLRAVENFPITGYRIHEELIIAIAMVKKAAALANMDTKRLYEGLGNVIVQAADEIIEGKWHDPLLLTRFKVALGHPLI